MSNQGYLRHPTVAAGTVVFVHDDDLWSVALGGGTARRLTAGLGEPSTPCLSPDGRWIAYVGRDEQHPEVYVMPAQGGPARRLTYLGPEVMVRGWTESGQILFVTTHGQPFFRNYRAFTIDSAGGLPQLLPLGQVNHLAFGPGNARVIGRNTADPARWKRYRGGMAGHLWIDASGSGEFRRMTELKGNISSPMWVGDRVYFLSDYEGVGNIYSCLPDGAGLQRHTDHDDFYARHAQTDGAAIVYQCGAKIWCLDTQSNVAKPIDIQVPGHRAQAARRFVAAAEFLQGFHLHPAGHSLALDVRGKPFTFGLWEGAVRSLGADEGRRQHGQWLGDGATFISDSDASGEERLEVFRAGNATALPWDIGRVVSMCAAPSGARVAISNHRNEIMVGDIDSGEMRVVDRSDYLRTEGLAWSPDGAWLAYQFWTSARHSAIKLYEVATHTTTLVTQPDFRDYCPSFDPAGKYLYFLSVRTFDPVYDSVQFEMSFPRAARPYLIALQASAAPPFDPPPKGFEPPDKAAAKAARNDGDKDKQVLTQVDLPGITARVAAFPVAESRYGQIAGVAGGKVVWSHQVVIGAHGRGGHKEAAGRLELFDFATLLPETMVDKADRFVVNANGTALVLQDGKKLRAIAADRKPEDAAAAAGGSEAASRKTGWIDLGRVRVSVSPAAEWRQMLREVWRLQRDHFWTEDMSGIDWDAMYRRYAPLLEGVATRVVRIRQPTVPNVETEHRNRALDVGELVRDPGGIGEKPRIHFGDSDPTRRDCASARFEQTLPRVGFHDIDPVERVEIIERRFEERPLIGLRTDSQTRPEHGDRFMTECVEQLDPDIGVTVRFAPNSAAGMQPMGFGGHANDIHPNRRVRTDDGQAATSCPRNLNIANVMRSRPMPKHAVCASPDIGASMPKAWVK